MNVSGQLSLGSVGLVGHSVALPKFLGEFKFLEEFCLTDRNCLEINLGIIISIFSDCINGRDRRKIINSSAKSG